MYIPGRTRTASRPSSTSIFFAEYSPLSVVVELDIYVVTIVEISSGLTEEYKEDEEEQIRSIQPYILTCWMNDKPFRMGVPFELSPARLSHANRELPWQRLAEWAFFDDGRPEII